MREWRTRARPDYCLTGAARILSTISLVGAGAHRLTFRAFYVNGRRTFAVDVYPDTPGLSFAAAFLAFTLAFSFTLSLPFAFALTLSFTLTFGFSLALALAFSFHLSFPLSLRVGVGAHAERDSERGDAGRKCKRPAAGHAGCIRV